MKEGICFMRKENNENIKKEFTKRIGSNIIEKDYNPSKVNYKIIYKRRDGLYVKGEVLKVVKRISKKYNKKEKLIFKMIEECKSLGYDMQKTEELIEEFYKSQK